MSLSKVNSFSYLFLKISMVKIISASLNIIFGIQAVMSKYYSYQVCKERHRVLKKRDSTDHKTQLVEIFNSVQHHHGKYVNQIWASLHCKEISEGGLAVRCQNSTGALRYFSILPSDCQYDSELSSLNWTSPCPWLCKEIRHVAKGERSSNCRFSISSRPLI